MEMAKGFAHCQFLVLVNEPEKLKSISNRNVQLLIQHGWRDYRKTVSDRRRTNQKMKQKALDWILDTLEALNNEQFRRLKSAEFKRFTQAFRAGTLFRGAQKNMKIIPLPVPPKPPRHHPRP